MKRRPRIPLHVAALALILAAACRVDAQSAGSPPPLRYPGVSARLEAPNHVRQGDSLALRLVLRNDTSAPIFLPMTWGGDQGFDPIARDARGRVVWQAALGRYRFADGESRIIQPHQTTTYRATWNLRDSYGVPLPPGRYSITGRLIDGRDSVIVSAVEVPVVITR